MTGEMDRDGMSCGREGVYGDAAGEGSSLACLVSLKTPPWPKGGGGEIT